MLYTENGILGTRVGIKLKIPKLLDFKKQLYDVI